MQLLIKATLRSITAKPIRTAVIVLCLAAVSLTFSLCLTISASSRAAVEDLIRSGMGKADITVQSKNGFDKLPDLPTNTDCLPAVLAHSYFQIHDISNYKYVQKKNINILGIDTERAAEFGLLPKCSSPKDGEAVISYAMAQRFGYDAGDTITLPCADGTAITLTVSEIVLNKGFLSVIPLTAVVTPETAGRVLSAPDIAANVIYVASADGKTSETAELISEKYPDYAVVQLTGTAEIEDSIRSLTRTFFIIFAVTLLMILFIISAFSKNIAAERLSVIGTLRSIGAEKKTAAMTLLTECALYGIIGGIFGTVLFYALKDVLLGNMMPSVNGFGGNVHVPLYIPLIGLVISAVISCSVSILTVIRISKMPVRDIIFSGRDSVYRPSFAGTIIGAVFLCGAAGLYFAKCGFVCGIISLAAFVVGLCLIIPRLMSAVSSLTAGYTNGGKMPVLRFAVIQSGTKKAVVTGTVICTAALLLTASLYVLSRSVDKLYSVKNYDCDVIISELSENAKRYDVITADKKEFIYKTEEAVEVNGRRANISVFGYDSFNMFSGIRGLPAELSDNEIAFDKLMMKRLGISEGDTVTLALKNDTVRPVTLTLTAVSGIDSIYFDHRCNAALISLDTYKSVYHDYPSMLLAEGDIGLIRRQLIDKEAQFETAEEYYARNAEESGSITGLLYSLAVMGVLLAVISVSGEQMIGFEQRRRELALLRSQGMSIGQLSKMLFVETLLTALIPIGVYLCAGRAVILLITNTLAALDMNIQISYERTGIAVFLTLISSAVILTVLIPIFSMKRMKTAAELKCE